MWEALNGVPRGRMPARKFIMAFTTLLVTSFAYLLFTAPTAHAADAQWADDSGTTITYDGHDYKDHFVKGDQATDSQFTIIPKGSTFYAYVDSSAHKFHIIYFAPGADYTKASTASYVVYDYSTRKDPSSGNPVTTYSHQTTPVTITVTQPRAPPTTGTTSCVIEKIGWIICPVTNFLADFVDHVFGIIATFLEVRPLNTTQTGPTYKAWSVMRDFANVMFVIALLVLVYGQVSGGLVSNYTIKKMMPRIIIAAVLVNLSYWICAVAVDLSNVLGYTLNDTFLSIRNSLVNKTASNTWDVTNWGSIVTGLASGGAGLTGLVIGGVTLTAAMAGGAAGALYVLLPLLISITFVITITFFILAARQALIFILIVIAPIAFVAYLLPNTEKWFERWRESLITLLVVFPAFSVIFGGSQLASTIIIQNATGSSAFIMILLGMAVQVIPLAITPLLLKLGGGLLNRFAGIVNNPTKGVFDRSKNWANARRDEHLSRGYARLSAQNNAGTLGRFGPRRAAYNRERRRLQREGEKSANEALTKGYFSQTADARSIHHLGERAKLEQGLGDNESQAHWNDMVRTPGSTLYQRTMRSHEAHSRADLYKKDVDVDAAEHWSHTLQQNSALRAIRTQTHLAEKRTNEHETQMTKDDDATWDNLSKTDANTQALRLQTAVATDRASDAEKQYNIIIEEARVKGGHSRDIHIGNTALADELQRLTTDIAVSDDVINSAKLVQRAEYSELLKADISRRKQAAGIDKKGEVRVLAAAKKAVSDEIIKATQNFFDTMDYDLASDPDKLEIAWDDAVSRGELSEIIAYARKLSVNQPGLRKLKPLLERFTDGKDPLSEDVMIVKEVLAHDQTFRDAGRDLEVWANNEVNGDTNRLYENFAEVRNASGPYANIHAVRFARMNTYSQEEALYWLQQHKPENLSQLLEGIGDESGQIWRELKGSTREMIKNIRGDSSYRIPDPNASNPNR